VRFGEQGLSSIFLGGMHTDSHVSSWMEIEELPLLLVRFVVDFGIDSGFPETRSDVIGWFALVERRDSDELFHN
jgi:hypothetical protein